MFAFLFLTWNAGEWMVVLFGIGLIVWYLVSQFREGRRKYGGDYDRNGKSDEKEMIEAYASNVHPIIIIASTLGDKTMAGQAEYHKELLEQSKNPWAPHIPICVLYPGAPFAKPIAGQLVTADFLNITTYPQYINAAAKCANEIFRVWFAHVEQLKGLDADKFRKAAHGQLENMPATFKPQLKFAK